MEPTISRTTSTVKPQLVKQAASRKTRRKITHAPSKHNDELHPTAANPSHQAAGNPMYPWTHTQQCKRCHSRQSVRCLERNRMQQCDGQASKLLLQPPQTREVQGVCPNRRTDITKQAAGIPQQTQEMKHKKPVAGRGIALTAPPARPDPSIFLLQKRIAKHPCPPDCVIPQKRVCDCMHASVRSRPLLQR